MKQKLTKGFSDKTEHSEAREKLIMKNAQQQKYRRLGLSNGKN